MNDKVIGCERNAFPFFRCNVSGRTPNELCPYGPHGTPECKGHRDDFKLFEVIDAYENGNRIHKRLPRKEKTE